jgi:GTP-binding protein
MEISQASFVISNTDYRKCPPPFKPEFAFIGRSNVGKSSLINMLCQRKNLARISVKPGKTQLINHFLIDESWYLVDLPGYGYAKVSKTERAKWQEMIDGYLLNRINLMCTFLLIDLRIPPQDIDLRIMEGFAENGLPFALLFTKADKLKPAGAEENLENYRNYLLESWEELPPHFTTSAEKGWGRDEVLKFIKETMQVFDPEVIKQKMPQSI